MDLTNKRNIKNLLQKYGLRPSKRLGQNFLIDKGVIKKIVSAAKLDAKDTVLEIGPGMGTLTYSLAQNASKVIAVEKDQKMVEILKETLEELKNVEVIRADIRNWEMAAGNSYKVVGNLPFYLTAPLIRKFLELTEVQPLSMVLGVQKEVGQRICARPPKMNLLAVSIQFYTSVKIISYISKKSFWPQPKVDAAIIEIVPQQPLIGESETFFKIVKAGFSQPRKQLINNLSKGLNIDRERVRVWLQKNNIQPIQRAETLKIEDWIHLTINY